MKQFAKNRINHFLRKRDISSISKMEEEGIEKRFIPRKYKLQDDPYAETIWISRQPRKNWKQYRKTKWR